MTTSRRAASILVATGLVLGATSASAETDAHAEEPIRVAYDVHPSCPNAEAFLGQVSARTSRFRVAAEGETARVFTVTVEPRGSRSAGRLEIRDADGTTAERRVSAPDCSAVISGLALIVAVAIDPQAAMATEPEPEPEPRPPPPPTPLPARDARPKPHPARPFAFAVGANALATTGVAPVMAFGGALFVQTSYASAGWLSPTLRAGGLHAQSGGEPAPRGAARYALTAAELEGCPATIALGSHVALFPCAVAQGGRVWGRSAEIRQPKSSAAPWVSVGLSARLAARLSDRIVVEVAARSMVSVLRTTFVLDDPALTMHRIPLVHTSVTAGVAILLSRAGAHSRQP